MKTAYIVLLLSCICMTTAAQSERDSSDIFFQHLNLNEVVVSSPVGQIKRKQSATPVSVVTQRTLRQASSTNIVDAIARQPGLSQITTGSGISKPVIRGLGYNRIVCVADGVRQEGQQWGDEHGLEIDGAAVEQVEVMKGPASLIYGSDAMAGVVIFHPEAIAPEGNTLASIASEYQTNSGLFDYSLRLGGNRRGFVWNARYSEKMAHAYKNKYDGYVPGTQFHERAASGLLGINRQWGFSHLTLSYYHVNPSMAEGERDAVTGQLVYDEDQYPDNDLKTYHKALPYQQIHHYKAVLDNSFAVGDGLLKVVLGYQQNRRQEFEEHHHKSCRKKSPPPPLKGVLWTAQPLPLQGGGGLVEYGEGSHAGLDFRLHSITYHTHYQYNGLEGWRLTGGMNGMWQQSQNKGEEYLIPAYRLFDIGAFVTASKELPHWTLSGGLRFDHRHLHSEALQEEENLRFAEFSRDFSAVSGSLGAVWHVNSRLNIRANAARGFRAPNLSELGSNGVHHGTIRYEIGQRDLRPEYSWQADLGADYSHRFFTVEAAFFLNRIENYIYAAGIAPEAAGLKAEEAEGYRTFRYTQGDAVLKGFEVGIDVHPIHQLHIGSTFSMVDARQLHQPKEKRYLPLTPAPRWTAEVKWEFVHNGDHHTSDSHHIRKSQHHHHLDHILDNAFISIGLDHSFRQSHYYMADDTETATPAYTLLSATIGTDILLNKKRKLCEVYIIGENLLNTAYQSHLSRLKYADTNSVTGRRGIFNPGRNVTFKIVFPIRF